MVIAATVTPMTRPMINGSQSQPASLLFICLRAIKPNAGARRSALVRASQHAARQHVACERRYQGPVIGDSVGDFLV